MAPDSKRDPKPARLAVLGVLTVALAAAGVSMLRPPAPAAPAPTGPPLASAPASGTRPAAPGAEAPRAAVLPPAAPLAEGPYGAAVGTRLVFDLDARLGTELRRQDGAAPAQGQTLAFAGHLELTVVDRRGEEAAVAVRFPGLSVHAPSAGTEASRQLLRALADAMQRPVLVRIDTAGRAHGYRFPAELGFVEKGQVRALLAALRFVVPPEAESARTWTASDRDDTGAFEAAYAWLENGDADGRSLERRRTHYTELAVHGEGTAAPRVALEGRSTAVLSAALGWLVGARFDDRTALAIDAMHVGVRSFCTGTLALSSTDRVPPGALAEVDWEAPWEAVGADVREALALARARDLEQWRADLEGLDVHTLIARLSALVAAGTSDGDEYRDAWMRLARLLELEPELAAEVAARVAGGHLDEASASGLLTALGCAGTPQAQQALLQIHGDASVPEGLRGTAAVALLQVQSPTPAALDALLGAARGGDGELGRVSLMVLGTLAPRADAPLADGRRAIDALLETEPRCRAAGTLDAWIHALGNSGVPELAARAQRYLDAGDDRTREAAAAALRAARSPGAESALAQCALTDGSPWVRCLAAESLAAHGTDTARVALCEVLREDDAAEVREAAMLGLAQQMDATARDALRHAAAHDASAELRELAARLLAGA